MHTILNPPGRRSSGSNSYAFVSDFTVFVRSEDLLLFELRSISDNEVEGFSYIFTTWYVYL